MPVEHYQQREFFVTNESILVPDFATDTAFRHAYSLIRDNYPDWWSKTAQEHQSGNHFLLIASLDEKRAVSIDPLGKITKTFKMEKDGLPSSYSAVICQNSDPQEENASYQVLINSLNDEGILAIYPGGFPWWSKEKNQDNHVLIGQKPADMLPLPIKRIPGWLACAIAYHKTRAKKQGCQIDFQTAPKDSELNSNPLLYLDKIKRVFGCTKSYPSGRVVDVDFEGNETVIRKAPQNYTQASVFTQR